MKRMTFVPSLAKVASAVYNILLYDLLDPPAVSLNKYYEFKYNRIRMKPGMINQFVKEPSVQRQVKAIKELQWQQQKRK